MPFRITLERLALGLGVALALVLGASAQTADVDPEPPSAAKDETAVPARDEKKPDRRLAEQIALDLKTSKANLARIATAVHGHCDAKGGTLPNDLEDKNGKALLSWRVAILPYVGHKALYEKFDLNEAWDGPHNKKLLAKMPDVFRSPRVKLKGKGHTVYQVFTGTAAVFGRGQALTLPAGIPDGTSNTLMAVESSTATPWTKPGGIPFVRGKKLPDFGKAYGQKPLASMMDGSVRTLDLKKISAATLENAIDPADGNVLGNDWD